MLENVEPQNRNLFWPIAVTPLFIIDGWVLLAIMLGATDHLPAGWETFWGRSSFSPTRFDAADRRALGLTIGGLLIGNSIVLVRTYLTSSSDLGWVALGSLLVDFFALGIFFWTFRRGQTLWGLLWLGLWTLFNTFSIGTELARDLGLFFEWLPNRVLGMLY